MIVIPRRACRALPALARRCVAGRPRGPAPPVAFESRAGVLTAAVRTADAALAYTAPAAGGDATLVVPMDVLSAAAGAGDDPVELVPVGPGRGEARWRDRGEARAVPFDAVTPPAELRPPAPPADWHPVGPDFLAALHECGRATAREPGRYALDRVQVRGAAGEVAGTDGRTALVWGGFALPGAADLLVPAVPVFGCPELARAADVRAGRTADGLAVAAGPWRVHLPAAGGRFPDLAAVARRDGPAAAALDPRDAARLAARLPGLPGADAEGRPVTLELAGAVTVLSRDGATGRVTRVRLARSPAAGPPVRVGVDRRALARALALGCVTVRTAPERPVVFVGGDRTVVTVALDPLPAAAPAARNRPDPSPERTTAVRHESNGLPPAGRPDPPAADGPDPLAAAEELRAALADAGAKAGRLVVVLKARQKEKKALSQAWTTLRALNLGPGGTP